MKGRGLFVFGLLILVLTTSLSSAGLFDWFRIPDSIEITGNFLKEGEYVSGDCVECIDYFYGIWCFDDNTCTQDPQLYCTRSVYSSNDCGISYCGDTCLSLGYECGSQSVCGVFTDCGTCSSSNYEVCSSGNCVVDCSSYSKVSKTRVADSSAGLTSSNLDKNCCSNSNYCVVSGICYSSGSTHYSTGDYCYSGIWYGSKLDATCGNDFCDSGENYGNCPSDCDGECTSHTQCPSQVCKIKSCFNYNCVYSNVLDSTSCGSNGKCVSGSCIEPECLSNEDCDDEDISTKDYCQNIGSYNSVCNNEKITECIDGDEYCPDGCLIETDNDCSIGCGDGKIDPGETCSSCPADVKCAINQKCSNGECVLNIVEYNFTTSSKVVFNQIEEKEEVQRFVNKITAEEGITFEVDSLDKLPLEYSVPEGRRIIKILDIKPSKTEINALIEFKIYEKILISSISEVLVLKETEDKNWEVLEFQGEKDYSEGVYDFEVYTRHFSIFLITEPEYCQDGIFNPSLEECDESVEGSQNCNLCICSEGYEPDFEGGCVKKIDGDECSNVGSKICTSFNLYECSKDNKWVSLGKVLGECSVECLIGDTSCSGEIPLKCGSDYKWVSQQKISGRCGYVMEEKELRGVDFGDVFAEDYDPCLEGKCIGNRNNSKEDKNTWIIFLIIGIILMIVFVSYLIVRLNDPKNIKKREEKNPFKYSRPIPSGNLRRPVQRGLRPQNKFYPIRSQRRNFVYKKKFNSQEDYRKFKQ
jgi:hypothetical protein